jgi:hypothetical protein
MPELSSSAGEMVIVAIVLVSWIVLMRFVLPRLGIST